MLHLSVSASGMIIRNISKNLLWDIHSFMYLIAVEEERCLTFVLISVGNFRLAVHKLHFPRNMV